MSANKFKVLIIGSEGFIGHNLMVSLGKKGYDLYGADLMDINPTYYKYYKLNRLQPDFANLFQFSKFDYCINVAGSGSVPLSISEPFRDFDANVNDTFKLLDAIRVYNKACKYLHVSSAAVYGNPITLPVAEDAILSPLSPYGYHKYLSEIICKEFVDLHKMQIVILRPFSVYGPGLKKQLIWDICEKINVADIITLYGTGNESRDFLHIADLCKLIDTIILKSEFKADVYNAATGVETTIRELADIFENIFRNKKRILFSGEFRIGDPINWRADISKINKLDFKPTVSLENGIKNYLDLYLQLSK